MLKHSQYICVHFISTMVCRGTPKKKLLKPKQIPHSHSHFLYLQLFHYTLSTVFTTPSDCCWMQIMTSYSINSKWKKKMEIDDSEVNEQHFCRLYIPSGPQSSNHVHQT